MAASPSTELAEYLAAGRGTIEAALDRALPGLGTKPAVLYETVRYTLLAPGKRLRGIVVLAAYDLLGPRRADPAHALAPACAVEMVHASSLILDDLPSMDDANLRRGREVPHRVFGEANAILAAVWLLNAAFDTLQRAPDYRSRLRGELSVRLAEAIGGNGLIGGQVADLESTGRRLDLEALEYVHSHKTGALFIAAAEMGALVAGGKSADLAALHRYAKNLGLAFQITDDLLDSSGDPRTMGKDAGQDRDHTTFVNLSGIDGAQRLVDELIDTSVAALSCFGRRAARLVELAEFVRCRDR